MAVDLFDNWFDPIEIEVRARARQFIEELIRGEFDTALARPRYERSKMAGNEAGRGLPAGKSEGPRVQMRVTLHPGYSDAPASTGKPRRRTAIGLPWISNACLD
jgi:hypothetical protein